MKQSAYKEAGVDIEAGAELVERIKPAIKKTMRSGVMSGIGGFGALFDPKAAGYNDPVLVSATDGVGTKLKIAIDTGMHKTVGIDLVAMCVNDLIVQGAEPLFFLDYFATGKLELEAAEDVVNGIAKGCEISGCALIGGETAEMPGMYGDGDYDLAGFTVGAVDRNKILTGERVKEGDVIIGLAASGLHSNGYSLVRKIVGSAQGYNYDSKTEFTGDKTLGEVLLTPTKIYVKSILSALKINDENDQSSIHGIANITGGGLTENIPRSLPDDLAANIDAKSWVMPDLFKWLANTGNLSSDDMAVTLNCGVGIVVMCDPKDQDAVMADLKQSGEDCFIMGNVIKKADDCSVIIHNVDECWK